MVALGLGLRLWGINFGLPFMYHPDEGVPVSIALRIFRTGNLNPNFFNWPSSIFYLDALAYAVYFIFGRLLGRFASPADLTYPNVEAIAVGKAALPAEFLIGRGLTAICGALVVILVYVICRQMFSGRVAGWIAAFWLAVESLDVRNSQFIRPDTYLVFFALFSLFFAIKILDDPQPRNYILAALGAGLATSFKYNAGLIFIPILVAHSIRFRARGVWRKEIYLAALVSAAVFLLTTPYAILDWQQFVNTGPLQDAIHYSTGHVGAEGNSLQWYIALLWNSLGGLIPLGLGEAFVILIRRDAKGLVFLSFPLVYFVFVCLYTVHFDTTILPVVPFILIAAARFIARVYDFALRRWPMGRRAIAVAMIAVALFLGLPMLSTTAANDARLLQTDSRETARVWIERNLPPGSRIALEAYSPYVDPHQFVVEGMDGIIDHDPAWYVQNGFEYLVFSYGAFGRFYENPTLYADYISRYNAFFSRFPELMRFDDNGYQIRILKTNVTGLPSQRVAARFGVYGSWLELVGYDAATQVGQINLTLYWRALAARRTPLQLTTRLLDQNNQSIAQTRGDLFGVANAGARWPQGIVRVPVKIAVPGDAAGLYRVELDVDAEGIGRVPVLSSDNTPASDKAFVGPIKIAPAPPSSEELQRASPSGARFGNVFALQAYRVDATAHAGARLTVTLYWADISKTDNDYTIFVHLLDSTGALRAQIDAPPRDGAYPTSLWDAGGVIRDDYALALPSNLAPGEYRIEIGAYAYPSLTRLNVTGADGKPVGNSLILASVQVQ
jgi:hypothetical protein